MKDETQTQRPTDMDRASLKLDKRQIRHKRARKDRKGERGHESKARPFKYKSVHLIKGTQNHHKGYELSIIWNSTI